MIHDQVVQIANSDRPADVKIAEIEQIVAGPFVSEPDRVSAGIIIALINIKSGDLDASWIRILSIPIQDRDQIIVAFGDAALIQGKVENFADAKRLAQDDLAALVENGEPDSSDRIKFLQATVSKWANPVIHNAWLLFEKDLNNLIRLSTKEDVSATTERLNRISNKAKAASSDESFRNSIDARGAFWLIKINLGKNNYSIGSACELYKKNKNFMSEQDKYGVLELIANLVIKDGGFSDIARDIKNEIGLLLSSANPGVTSCDKKGFGGSREQLRIIFEKLK